MATIDLTSEFTISVTGKRTGQTFTGLFKAKKYLSHKDYILRDRLRREMLGDRMEQAEAGVFNTADALAQCRVRVVSAPSWWVEADWGGDLIDDEPVQAVYDKVIKIEAEALKAIQSEAQDAKKDLQGMKPPATATE